MLAISAWASFSRLIDSGARLAATGSFEGLLDIANRLAQVGTVPEPGMLALLLIACTGLARRRFWRAATNL